MNSHLSHHCIKVGTHGIIIQFKVDGRKYNSTYLPEVAHEQGWNHDETVDSLIRKSGYRGTISVQLKAELNVTRYQSSKVKLTYAEYLEMVAERE